MNVFECALLRGQKCKW